MDNIETLKKKLEWSSQRACAPYSMGGPTPYYLPACPLCKGVKPSERAKTEFQESAIGHQEGCPFLDEQS